MWWTHILLHRFSPIQSQNGHTRRKTFHPCSNRKKSLRVIPKRKSCSPIQSQNGHTRMKTFCPCSDKRKGLLVAPKEKALCHLDTSKKIISLQDGRFLH